MIIMDPNQMRAPQMPYPIPKPGMPQSYGMQPNHPGMGPMSAAAPPMPSTPAVQQPPSTPGWHGLMNPLFLGGLGMLGMSMPGMPIGTNPFQGWMMGAGLGGAWEQRQAELEQQELENQAAEAQAMRMEELAQMYEGMGDFTGAARIRAGKDVQAAKAPSLKQVVGPDGRPMWVTAEDALGQEAYSQPPISISMGDAAAKAGAVAAATENARTDVREGRAASKGENVFDTYKQAGKAAQGMGGVALDPQARQQANIARDALVTYVAKNVLGTPGAEPSPALYDRADEMVPDFSGIYDARVFDSAMNQLQQAIGDALRSKGAGGTAPAAGGVVDFNDLPE